jgi:galactose mutarotase-like enzyme
VAGFRAVPARYEVTDSTQEGIETVTLASTEQRIEASFAPKVGMIGSSFRHAGEELLGQRGGLAKYAEVGSTMGIPLLYPWANRLSGFEYEAAGRRVELDPESKLIRKDPNGLPIHGLLNASPYWAVTGLSADADGARLAAELDFAAHEDLMAAFPFPHRLTMEATVSGSALTIATTVEPTGDAAVPIAFGFHPYPHLPHVPRAEWQVALPVRRRLILDEHQIPTGASEPVRIEPGPLGDRHYDDGFSELDRPPRFVLAGGGRRLVVELAKGFEYAQVYAPADQDVICFEPMTAPTNALVAGGPELRLVEPGGSFTAVFSLAVEAASR